MRITTQFTSVGMGLRQVLQNISDVLVPPTCLTCDRYVATQGACCAQCWTQFRFITKPICPVMGSPFSVSMGEGFLSAEAIADPPPFDRLRAVMLYDDLARQLVSRMKYSDRSDLARWMGLWMVRAGHDLLKDVDVIVPVPLHPSRLRQRRYNQAAELSRSIARKAKVDFKAMALQRKRSTRQQVGLTEKERDRNVSGAFIVPERQKIEIQGRRVLLIDDVYTTGATAKAATRALKRGGASAIDVLVFAKVETYQV